MEKVPIYNGENNSDQEFTIYSFEELYDLVKQVYFHCPDEPFMNSSGNLEPWSLYLVSDLVVDNLTDESRNNIYLDMVNNSSEYGIYYEETERGCTIQAITQSLITESVVQVLLRDESIGFADEKRLLLSGQEYWQ